MVRSSRLLTAVAAPALAWVVGAFAPAIAAASLSAHPNPTVRELWEEGRALEQREELVASSQRYEAIADELPASVLIRWRLSRNYWRYAERLPLDDKRGRLHFFDLARDRADAALGLDAECGECVFWKMAALGRIVTTRGVFRAAASASTIARLIERGIALQPTHADGPQNVTLANLYYAGSAFYRIVPDWFWLKLLLGVRGDRQRALDYIQRAIAISDERLDYRVELGAVLLCIGSAEREAERIEEGRAVLREAITLEDFQTTDSFDRAHAGILMAEPAKACGYSRDGWIDFGRAERQESRP